MRPVLDMEDGRWVPRDEWLPVRKHRSLLNSQRSVAARKQGLCVALFPTGAPSNLTVLSGRSTSACSRRARFLQVPVPIGGASLWISVRGFAAGLIAQGPEAQLVVVGVLASMSVFVRDLTTTSFGTSSSRLSLPSPTQIPYVFVSLRPGPMVGMMLP